MAETTSPVPETPLAAPAPGEGCPPPLQWQDVVRTFRQQADAWYLDRDGYRLEGRTWGTGRPLYFLNGIGGTLDLFALLVHLLRDEFRCVLFDYPGTRPGSKIPARGGLPELAGDVLAIADQSGDAHFDLYATSFGTLVAAQLLVNHPQRIDHAILQGGFAHRDLSFAERSLIRLGRFLPGTMRAMPGRRAVQHHNHRRWFPPFDETRYDFFSENNGSVPIRAIAHRAGLIHRADFRPRLREVQTPLLLLRGESEGVLPDSCHTVLEQGLPHAQSEILLNTGHLPFLTHPHRIAKAVRLFLNPVSEANAAL